MHTNFHLGQRRAADSSHTGQEPRSRKSLGNGCHSKMQLIRKVATKPLISAKLSEFDSVVKFPCKQFLYTPTTAILEDVQLSHSG